MNAIVLLGPPGAGKGTVSDVLIARGYNHISTGNLLREQIRLETPLGLQARERMDRGSFVPDDVVVGMIREVMAASDGSQKFLFDGFPRTLIQAQMLEKLMVEVNGEVKQVVLLDCPDHVIIDRLVGRRTCGKCGSVYHVTFNPPSQGNVCDVEGCELSQRADDTEETVRKRLAVYQQRTEPLIAYYKEKNLIVTINANQSIAEVRADVSDALGVDAL